MVTMQLMINNDDRKKINKSPGNVGGALSCTLKENTSILKPTMIVSTSSLSGNWAGANYAHIKEFAGRYYFIDDVEALTGGRMAFHLSVDVLKSYASILMGTAFMIARSEDLNSPYFVDSEKILQSKKLIYYTDPLGHIPQSATGNKFTITVAGGI